MQYVRTQIYLDPEQHRALKAEAGRRGVSLARLLRQLVDEALVRPRPRGDLTGLVALWDSGEQGGSDVARHKDAYVAAGVLAAARRSVAPAAGPVDLPPAGHQEAKRSARPRRRPVR